MPDLSTYRLHRVVEDSPVWGVTVPGLRVAYYRHGGRATAGLYAYQGVEIFVAWGYLDERHCRFHAFRDPDGDWEPPQPGCPRVRAQPGGELVLRTGNGVRKLPPAQSAVSTSRTAWTYGLCTLLWKNATGGAVI